MTEIEENQPYIRLPGLLGKLAKMTSIRDTELLEQSLLKSLGPLLGVLDTSLYRTDDTHALIRVIHHHLSEVIDEDGVARMVERIEEVNNIQDIPDAVISLTDNVRLLSKPCACKQGDGVLIAYPLMAADEVCGYFVFQRDREVTSAEDPIIRGVLNVFSNYFALLEASQRDRLTGLLNRQTLEASFDRIWALIARPVTECDTGKGRRATTAGSYWLGVMDIDHFKVVNDSHGHIIGDEVLLLVSRLMANSFRGSDLLYRYGGEEFVAIVSADVETNAWSIFERVRKIIEAHNFPRVGQVTVSCGFCRADPLILPQEVLSRADRSLYQAKKDGRNRVYDFDELVSKGVFQEVDYGTTELF